MRMSDWCSDVCSSDLGSVCVVAPLVACLGEGLEDGHGGDAGATTFGHENRQRRKRGQVADLIERQQQGRVEAGSGRCGCETAGGFDEVFDECHNKGPGGASASSG